VVDNLAVGVEVVYSPGNPAVEVVGNPAVAEDSPVVESLVVAVACNCPVVAGVAYSLV